MNTKMEAIGPEVTNDWLGGTVQSDAPRQTVSLETDGPDGTNGDEWSELGLEDISEALRSSSIRWIFVAGEKGTWSTRDCCDSWVETLALAIDLTSVGSPRLKMSWHNSGPNNLDDGDMWELIQVLRRRHDVQFVLAWQVDGSSIPHLAYSDDLTRIRALDEVSEEVLSAVHMQLDMLQ